MTGNSEIKRNGSGYYDETAYKAIRNLENRGGENMSFNKGEIYEIEMSNNNVTRKGVIVSENSHLFHTVILLTDEEKGVVNVPIIAQGKMYADCKMLSYVSERRIGNFIRNATKSEMEQLEDGICKALGISRITENGTTNDIEIEKLKEELRNKKVAFDNLSIENSKLKMDVDALNRVNGLENVEMLKRECDLYKDMYENILTRLIER